MGMEAGTGVIESRADYESNPRGQYDYWTDEIEASQRAKRQWHIQGNRIVRRFIDYRREKDVAQSEPSATSATRLNLFHANITTLMSMLYGNLPKVDVSRRYADSKDDVSRVAAEMMERILNNDIAENGKEINSVLRATLQDRLLPGLGCARVRYEVETEKTQMQVRNESGETVTIEEERVVFEDAPIDYFHWRDVLWGWGRTWSDIKWVGYRSFLTKDEVAERFGEDVAKHLEYRQQLTNDGRQTEEMESSETSSVWQKAEIWEIWDKSKRQVVFYSKGLKRIIETKQDPLGLRDFFPSPPFFMANATTSLYEPTPDYHIAQDLYNEVDRLQTRITIITEAVKVVGVYAGGEEAVSRMFKEGMDNTLIPVDNWALFSEKGGLEGVIQWVPIGDIVGALDKLRELRDDTISLLYQVTGMSDVLRGSGGGQYEGVGQAELKAKFGSVRVQALQDEFADFVSDIMQIKAEIVSKHFDPETIAKRSNIALTPDAEHAQAAIELIKKPREARLKVIIRPESVAMVDYAQLKAERTEFINALAVFLQSSAPLLEQQPAAMPFLMQLLQWGLAGFKGSSEIEGVIDKAIEQAENDAKSKQGQPDPEQIKMQMQMQMEQAKTQAKMQEIQAKAEADIKVRKVDEQSDIATAMANHKAKIAQIDADMQASLAEVRAKMEADLVVEQAQTEANIIQAQQAANSEIQKDAATTGLEIEKEAAKTAMKIEEIAASSSAKINESEQSSQEANDAE